MSEGKAEPELLVHGDGPEDVPVVDRWIVAAGNVANPCLALLRQGDFALRLDEEGELIEATRQGLILRARFPEELLGLMRLAKCGEVNDNGAHSLRKELRERAATISSDAEGVDE